MHTLQKSILVTIFIFPLCTFAQNSGTIDVGTSITASKNSSHWLSPSGDFAFGFQQLQNNTDLFILSIWFNKIPDRTIVWFERSSYPVPRGSTLRLDAEQGLLLQDSRGSSLWNSNDISNEVSHGYMNDTGNFILSDRKSAFLWESFSNPGDTILPTQTIEIGGMLISRMGPTNFSHGKYFAHMVQEGDFLLHTRSVPLSTYFDAEYYNSQTSDVNNASNSGYQVLFNQNGVISVLRANGQQQILTLTSNPPSLDNYYRATLDFDGIFTLYYHPKSFSGNPGWIALTFWPDNICVGINGAGSGPCGYNNICRLVDHRPVCKCPQGFTLVDPNNPYGDCLPMLPDCVAGENSSAFELLEIEGTNWYGHDYEFYPTSEDNCRNSCLNDCLCGVVVYELSSKICWKKTFPLANGRIDITNRPRAFLKLRRGHLQQATPDLSTAIPPKRGQKTLIVVGSVLLGSSVFFNLLFVVAACFGCLVIYNTRIRFLNLAHSTAGVNLRCFMYKELMLATDGFKEELGRGAFGVVYKGVTLDDSKTAVAVKKLDRVSQDSEKEFRAEVNAIGQTHHKNLVCLLGFCEEGPNRLLVYEYMSNGTLADFLFSTSKVSWSQRCLMALGVARGLTYLHEECITQIIHCDIKPQNILIDEHYNARISDFGLAKLLKIDQTRSLTNIRGTKGYVAPEWFRNMQITMKVDVYSFGVLLLETISCRRNVESSEKFGDEENPILTDWVWDCYQENRLGRLVDDDMEALCDRKRLERFVMVGIWCIQEDVSLRPTMRKVSQMLEGIVDVAVPPCPSPFNSVICMLL